MTATIIPFPMHRIRRPGLPKAVAKRKREVQLYTALIAAHLRYGA